MLSSEVIEKWLDDKNISYEKIRTDSLAYPNIDWVLGINVNYDTIQSLELDIGVPVEHSNLNASITIIKAKDDEDIIIHEEFTVPEMYKGVLNQIDEASRMDFISVLYYRLSSVCRECKIVLQSGDYTEGLILDKIIIEKELYKEKLSRAEFLDTLRTMMNEIPLIIQAFETARISLNEQS